MSRRRKSDRGARSRIFLPTALALVGFSLIWGSVVWFAYYSLSSLPTQPQHLSFDGGSSAQRLNALADPNPFFGWQPLAAAMECSWRECFKKDHTCRTCRDTKEDMGEAPKEPSDWIPDVTLLKRMRLAGQDAQGRPWPPVLPDKELCENIGPNGGTTDSNKELLDRVPIIAQPPRDNDGPRILCMIYTMESSHATTVRAVRETWASHCDGFLAFSTASDPRIPAISLPHDGPEEYQNMWQKIRSILFFVGTHYTDEFDWFFQGGDDLFVLPQNLRDYLSTMDPNDDHFVGRRFKSYDGTYFNSGGSGYALSRGILRKYVTEGWDHPQCARSTHTSMEDVMIARCLSRVFNVGLTDTRDKNGRERFHPFAPGTHLYWRPPGPGDEADWYADYNREWGVKLGIDCCAPDSVSFHYVKKPAQVRHLYALLYQCDHPT